MINRKNGFVFGLAALLGIAGCSGQKTLTAKKDEPLFANTPHVGTPVEYSAPTAAALDFRAPAKKVLPSVVSVDQYKEGRDMWGASTGEIMKAGTGSGVVLSTDGYIITNNHVINGSSSITVRTSDKRNFEAKLVGTDPTTDLALLKIEAKDLVPIELGDSSKVEVGQWVLAVGNPLGYDGTVSAGVVSSLGRSLQDGANSYLVGAIQTDAPINPGNSGGALVDTNGKLVGINTAIASQNGGSVGIGFAIPVNRVRRVAEDIRKFGGPKLIGLGIEPTYRDPETGEILGPDIIHPSRRMVQAMYQRRFNVTPPEEGVVIVNVDSNGAAAKAGIAPLDIITRIDDVKISNFLDLRKALADRNTGDVVSISYWHKGEIKTAKTTLMEILPAPRK